MIGCNEGDIRLVDGPTNSEGTLEICSNKLWGIVSDINWGNSAAQVVCRQLGLSTES